MTSRRIFFALPLAEAARHELTKALASPTATRTRGPLRWTRPESWHCTLKFVGSVRSETAANLIRDVARDASCQALPDVLPSHWVGVDGFPSLRRARVLVAHLSDEGDRLSTLARALDELTAAYDIPAETRAYRPHITLARLRAPANLLDLREEVSLSGAVELGPLTLYESHLGRSGSRYEALWSGGHGA